MESSDRYSAPNEIHTQPAYGQLPPKIFKTILWLIDSDAYTSRQSDYNPTDDIKKKSTSIAERILFASKNVLTTQHVGLAMQLHNDFSSRGLIDTLHAYGLCICYDDLRCLLTSTAEEEINRIQEGLYLPTGIIARNEDGNLIHGGDDNIDINAGTIDGENTFHAMAHVVFKDKVLTPTLVFQVFPKGKESHFNS